MRQLRLIRIADTGELVLDSADGLESFALRVDEALRAAVRSVPAAAPAAPATPAEAAPSVAASGDVQVGPREIQVRVRAGESPEHLAASLGVPLERVMRFAGPVMAERLRITDEARRGRARRAGSENDVVVFGEAVDLRFTAHGLVPADVMWDSRRRDDGDWVVVAEWDGGEGRHGAEWLFHRATRTVTPIDDTAADLLSDRPIRPVVPPQSELSGRPDLRAAPPLAPGVVAFPPMPEALTGPLPRYEEVFDQDAPPEGPRDVPQLVPTTELEYTEQPLPLGITDPAERPAAAGRATLTGLGGRRGESEDDKATRARVPSWDDILLGVRRKD